jgi:ABC-type xylose transport system permease subunit
VNVSPTLRGFAVLVAIAAVVTLLQLGAGLVVVLIFVQALFIVVIAYVLFTLWRRRREEIAEWSLRSRLVFYGGAALTIAAIVLLFFPWVERTGLDTALALVALVAGVFAMWRVWRDEHTYGY